MKECHIIQAFMKAKWNRPHSCKHVINVHSKSILLTQHNQEITQLSPVLSLWESGVWAQDWDYQQRCNHSNNEYALYLDQVTSTKMIEKPHALVSELLRICGRTKSWQLALRLYIKVPLSSRLATFILDHCACMTTEWKGDGLLPRPSNWGSGDETREVGLCHVQQGIKLWSWPKEAYRLIYSDE